MKTESHIKFLQTFKQIKMIPNGFQIRWQPGYIPLEKDCNTLHGTLKDTSIKLMDETLRHNINSLEKIRQSESRIWTTVGKESTPIQAANMRMRVYADVRKIKQKLDLVKQERMNIIQHSMDTIKDQVSQIIPEIARKLGIILGNHMETNHAEHLSIAGELLYKSCVRGDRHCLFHSLHVSVILFGTEKLS